MDARLTKAIDQVRSRLRMVRGLRVFAATALVASLVIAALWMMEVRVPTGPLIAGLTATAIGCVLAGLMAAGLSFRDPRQVAYRIERAHPDLGQRLLTALDQHPTPRGDLSYLQRRVIDSALRHWRMRHWAATVPGGRLRRSKLAATLATVMLIATGLSLVMQQPPATSPGALASGTEAAGDVIQVEPGDVEVERGSNLTVTARFTGDSLPAEVYLAQLGTDQERRTAMNRNLDDPVFAGFLPNIQEDFQYRIESDTLDSRTFQVRVYELPRMVRSDAEVQFPEYTGTETKTIEDTVRVTAAEGSRLTWTLHLNKPVAQATLIPERGDPLVLQAVPEDPTRYQTTHLLAESQRWTLRLVDSDGRENKFPPELTASVLPNQPAALRLVSAADATVSPLEELPVAADAQDDYGVRRAGITYTLGAGEEQEIELVVAEEAVEGQRASTGQLRHTVDFEQLGAEPDQLLSYHFWAEDIGPDGQPRRTTSDIFFAEVRPFEQIFREGNSPPGGGAPPPAGGQQQQQAQQAEQLGELQKQIVTALWNLIRQADLAGAAGDPSLRPEHVEDANTILQSQQTAREQLKSLTENLPPDRSPELVEAADRLMQETIVHLDDATSGMHQPPLHDAITAARGAYEALLRLRAREFDVVQSNQQQQQSGGGGGASRSQMQRQLDQLELRNDPNRYETQQTAQQQPESGADQAAQDALSRLRDLARRQEDLNEQLRTLEMALRKAETEAEREEAMRQLQRLREQQQEMLRDADELASRMRENANNQTMRSAADQLEQTRENLRQAEQALENSQPSEARAAGSRAARSLEEIRDEVRQETSAELTDRVQEMQQQARELVEQQRELRQALEEVEQSQASPGLRGGEDSRAEVADRFDQQSQRAEELIEQMRETIRQAEEHQPLVANRLYEAQREALRNQLSETLSTAGELLRHGYDPQARQAGDIASEQIEQLNREIESAARGILGDPLEALARAEGTLEQLAEQLASERGEDPSQQGDPQQGQGEGNQSQDGQQQEGQQGGQQQGGQQQDGQQQDGQQQDGQQQDGQQQDGQQQGDQQQGGQQQGGQQQDGQQQGDQQQGGQQQGGQQQGGQQQGGQQQGGQQQSGGEGNERTERGGLRPQQNGGGGGGGGAREQAGGEGGLLDGLWAEALDEGALEPGAMPITGDGYREWSDRMREVEDMLDDPDLRSRAAGIRDRARELRREVTRHGREPRWSEIEEMVAEPLEELRMEVSAERMRRAAERTAIVPMDRDPVPERYSEAVRKYYEQLGAGR